MILFEFSPFAKEILDKTQREFEGKPINSQTFAEIDNRIMFIEHLLEENAVSDAEKELFMQIYKKALFKARIGRERY